MRWNLRPRRLAARMHNFARVRCMAPTRLQQEFLCSGLDFPAALQTPTESSSCWLSAPGESPFSGEPSLAGRFSE
jgi:hypothetical protein